MAIASVPKLMKETTVTLSDGTGSPVTLELACIQNFTDPAPQPEQIVTMCRGVVTNVQDGDDAVYNITLDINFKEWTNTTAGVALDFLTNANAYSANVSTNTAFGYVVDLILSTAAESGQTTAAVKTHSDCKLVSYGRTPGKPDSISIELTVYSGWAVTGQGV